MILLRPLIIILPIYFKQKKKKKKKKNSHKHFSDYLSNESSCTMFLLSATY